MPQPEEPTTEEVVGEVARHAEGVNPVELSQTLESHGYQQNSVQRVIRSALDRGLIELGPTLLLRTKRAA